MSAERLLACYERVGDAADAVGQLRRFVLDLAVRGNLAPQDVDDGPVDDGLLRPEPERKRPVGRTGANLGLVTRDEVPIALPATWRWSRLFQLCVQDAPIVYGILQPGPDTRPEGVPYVRPSEIENGRIILSDVRYTTHEIAQRYARASVKEGDLIFTIVGTIGATAIVPRELDGGNITQSSCRLRVDPCLIDRRFLLAALRSDCVIDQISRMKLGTAVPRLNIAHVRAIAVPLPPLAEQGRIVAQVDELMALCDRLEAERARREATRDELTTVILARLNATPGETSEDDARSVRDAFPAISKRADQITQLRQTILNLAVWGKLVPQHASDEPASELLKQIAAEKAALLKAGSIRQEKSQKRAGSSELPFELRSGWEAATIRQILVELQTGPFGSSLHQSDYELGGVPVINPASIQNGRIVPIDKMAVGTSTLDRLSNFKLRAGDIVMGRRGEMGRCAIVTDREAGWLCGTGSLVLRLPKSLYTRFLVLVIGSPYARRYLSDSAVGATMQNLNQGILLDLRIGVPPLAEQHRIVAKVDELITLCDRLESSVLSGDETRRRLLEALLREALDKPVERAA